MSEIRTNFVMREIPRSLIRNHPLNPRTIDKHARSKLRKGLERFGLVEPLVWNERTGHLIGGHQRLTIMDAVRERRETEKDGNDDYLVPVAVIDVPAGKEKELLVFLNNETAQGSWDTNLLTDLLKDPEVKVDAFGFDALDLQMYLPDAEIGQLFAPDKPDDASGDKEEIARIKQASKTLTDLAEATGHDTPAPGEEGNGQPADDYPDDETIARMKAAKAAHKQEGAKKDDADFHLIVVFGSRDERTRYLKALGERDTRYIDGRKLANLTNVTLDEVP